jgi:hypothetical protein
MDRNRATPLLGSGFHFRVAPDYKVAGIDQVVHAESAYDFTTVKDLELPPAASAH